MKQLIFYLIWTFACSSLLKSSIDILTQQHIGYYGPIVFNVFLQVAILFPIISVIVSLKNK